MSNPIVSRKACHLARSLTIDQIRMILREFETGVKVSELTAKYGVSRSWIYRAKQRWSENDPKIDHTYLRAEIARLEHVIVKMSKLLLLPEADRAILGANLSQNEDTHE